MDITVGTGVWGDYGKYLPEWAESIAAQTVKPAAVSITDAGLDDPAWMHKAAAILAQAGIPTRCSATEHLGFGSTRNAPFLEATTEWAMHLDADDLLLPDGIETYAALQHEADVIAPGALRDGVAQLFPHASREAVLAARHSVLSCGAFRLDYWRRRPWHTRNDWIDTVFWIGLAHLGARIVPASKPVFVYRIHPDSTNHKWTRAERVAARQQVHDACKEWTLT